MPVQFRVERKPLLAVCKESREYADAPDSDENAERTTE